MVIPVLVDRFGRPMEASPEREQHSDSWKNYATGIGSSADKTRHGRFFPVNRILDQELTSLHNGSDIAAKIVDQRPIEMFRRGYDIECDGLSASQTDDLREFATEEMDLDTNMKEGMRWGRQYGGCLLLLNINDGGYPWEPLDEENIRSFDSISLVDRRYAYVQSQYSSMNRAKYGLPEIYMISNAVAVSGWNSHGPLEKKTGWQIVKEGGMASLVHESRVIRFDGNDTDIVTRQTLAGWTWSVLQRVYDAMRQFEHAFDSVGYLLADASQGVFVLQGLLKAITSGQRGAFADRLALMEYSRSVMRGIALDAGDANHAPESFTRVPTPLGGIAEIIDRMMLRLACAADMPATRLFGRAPAGLNATGDSDTRAWYDTIASEQEVDLTPKLKRIYRLLAMSKQGPVKGGKDLRFKIHHKPLWLPTDAETAATSYTIAKRDQIYLQTDVVKPEEVAVDLGDTYPNLDVEAREEVLKAQKSFEPYPNDPEPKPTGPGGGAGPAKGAFGAGPVSPTGSAAVSGSGQGEPIGGPQVPMPLLGGGMPPAKAGGKVPVATEGTPSKLRPVPKTKAKSKAGKDSADAHDPKQPRDRGKLAEQRASASSRDAALFSTAADASAEPESHLEAATAHAHASVERRMLAARHARLGNDTAAKKHLAVAADHDKAATAHMMKAGEIGGGSGD
jgi:hypothetical protein